MPGPGPHTRAGPLIQSLLPEELKFEGPEVVHELRILGKYSRLY
jgi:hypothetical protein